MVIQKTEENQEIIKSEINEIVKERNKNAIAIKNI